jgi:hypothetical protein
MRDRNGDPIDDDPPEHTCRQGWLHHPLADTPRPCPTCRPWLTAHPPRPPTRTELDTFRQRHPPPQRSHR